MNTEMIEKLRRYFATQPVERAWLFGSRARGDAHENSDWDVLVLMNKPKITGEDYDKISYPIRELGWETDEVINTILYTVNDWNKSSYTPFHKNVEKDGIVL